MNDPEDVPLNHLLEEAEDVGALDQWKPGTAGHSPIKSMRMNTARRNALVVAIFAALIAPGVLVGQVPHLSGRVDIDMSRGILSGEVCLSDVPEQDTTHFLLNHGLSLASVHDSTGASLKYEGYYNGTMIGEGLLYSITDSLQDPRRFCVDYTGAVPIYNVRDSVYKAFDFKGWIAHNGKTLRATEQSKWYPVPYDPTEDRSFESMSYRLRVSCPGCETIYVNGAPPGRGPEVDVTSALPYAPLLFVGDYGFSEIGGTLYLNSDISPAAAAVLSGKVAEIKAFYEDLLMIPYGDSIVFLEHEPVERFRRGRSWGFVTWRTIAFAGTKISNFVNGDSLSQPWVLRFIAHEMGHYYFGTLLQATGAYRWFLQESIPEYLALKAGERFLGPDAYRTVLEEYYEEIANDPELPQLDHITDPAAIDSRYRYRYGPLLLIALEREIGTNRMGKFLQALVTAPSTAKIDYEYLERAAVRVGVDTAAWQRFEQQCVQKEPRASCLAQIWR